MVLVILMRVVGVGDDDECGGDDDKGGVNDAKCGDNDGGNAYDDASRYLSFW